MLPSPHMFHSEKCMSRNGYVITKPDASLGAVDTHVAAAVGRQTSHIHGQADDTAQHDIEPAGRCQAHGTRRPRRRLLRRYILPGPCRLCKCSETTRSALVYKFVVDIVCEVLYVSSKPIVTLLIQNYSVNEVIVEQRLFVCSLSLDRYYAFHRDRFNTFSFCFFRLCVNWWMETILRNLIVTFVLKCH